MISFLKRSQKKRVSTATSREGGGAVGINFVGWAGQILRAVVLCHATVCRASMAKQNWHHTMQHNHVSTHDLEEDMRLNAHLDEVAQVRLACLERSGEISFITKK